MAPEQALFAVGYRNRFKLPAKEVMSRYRERAIQTHNTALHGAITVSAGEPQQPLTVSRHRIDTARFWNWRQNAP